MERTHTGEPSKDQTVTISMTYVPDYFDLSFRVKVEHTQQTKALMPQAVNVKIVAWNGEKWTIISQQEGEHGLPLTKTVRAAATTRYGGTGPTCRTAMCTGWL